MKTQENRFYKFGFGISFLIPICFIISSYVKPNIEIKRPLEVWAIRSVLDLKPRMLTLALDEECYLAYDLANCKLYKAWKGGISLEGAPYTDKKEIQPSSWGAAYHLDTLTQNQWAVELNGKNIFSKALYKGYRFENNQVYIKYALALSTNDTLFVEERPEIITNKKKISIERQFITSNVPATSQIFLFSQDAKIALKSNDISTYSVSYKKLPTQYPAVLETANLHPGRELMDKSDCFTCHQTKTDEVGPSFVRIAEKYPANEKSFSYLAEKIKKGSSGIWGIGMMNAHPQFKKEELTSIVDYIFTFKPKSKAAKKEKVKNEDLFKLPSKPGFGAPVASVHPSYDLVNLHTPTFKPRVGGLAFMPDGRLLVTTWDTVGGVYLLDGISSGDSCKIKVKRIASGLAEPLGIEVVDDEIYVLQKQELTKLIDLDGDEIIDDYQVVCNSWQVSNDFHEFAFGLVYKDGYFYATLSMAMRLKPDEKQLADRGKTIKIAKDGSFEAINFGLRTPNGIGLGIGNEIFVTDNQGQWTPANKLIHVKKGEYHGMNWGWLSDDPAPEMSMPAIWLPEHEIGNSPTEPVLIHEGIFKGQMLHGDVTFGGINRDFLEKINGDYQGAVFHFSQGFEAGVNRLRWGNDGNLYIGEVGMKGGGWSWKERLNGLQYLKSNGKSTFEMLAIRAKPNGFEIEFTEPLNAEINLKHTDLLVQQWWYQPTKNYGGPKMDLENLSISKIQLSEDRKRVYIEIPNLKTKHVIYFRLSDEIKSQSGQSLWSGETWYTLNNIPTEN
ncbi:cytochrome c [Spirosomataceae bacterium TFI 002]|nr:cytochrome c [Spirosomataceae bacterium TFI 002]